MGNFVEGKREKGKGKKLLPMPMPYALCPMPHASCPMPHALCPIFNASVAGSLEVVELGEYSSVVVFCSNQELGVVVGLVSG